MAYFKNIRTKHESNKILLGGGVNTSVSDSFIQRNECVSNLNMSSVNFPALSVRKGFQEFADSLTDIWGIGYNTFTTKLIHAIDGTGATSIWKRWNGSTWATILSPVSSDRSTFLHFSTSSTEYLILVNSSGIYSYDGSTVVTLTNAPSADLFTVDDRRLFALLGNILYCSAGDTTNDWTTAKDAVQITLTGARGLEKALCTYKDTVISFFEESMHILYGDDYYNFYSSDPIINIGCVGRRALVIHRDILYFCYKDGVYRYAGDIPTKISYKIDSYFEGIPEIYKDYITCGQHSKYIYISIAFEAVTPENNLTLEFDTQNNIWNVYNKGFSEFLNVDNQLYASDYDGQIWLLGIGTDDEGAAINSQWVSGWIDYNLISKKKRITRQDYLLYLPSGSSLTLYYSTNGTTWTSLKVFETSATEQIVKVPIANNELNNISRFKLKFIGVGPWYINFFDEYIRVKPRSV